MVEMDLKVFSGCRISLILIIPLFFHFGHRKCFLFILMSSFEPYYFIEYSLWQDLCCFQSFPDFTHVIKICISIINLIYVIQVRAEKFNSSIVGCPILFSIKSGNACQVPLLLQYLGIQFIITAVVVTDLLNQVHLYQLVVLVFCI